MSRKPVGLLAVRIAVLLLAVATVFAVVGCSKTDADTDSPGNQSDEKPAQEPPVAEEPTYTSWQVSINDEDSYTKDGITYTIALNLTATNPSANPAGPYTGSATAKTDSVGQYQGMQLNASAIANSTQLEFELKDPMADGALAPVTEGEPPSLAGTGSITMAAAGGGTYGPAGGSFANTSGQNLRVEVTGSAVTLTVDIDGHTYTFTGTISGM